MTLDPVRLSRVEFGTVVVTPWTEWTFARLWSERGTFAEVEITADADVVRLVSEQVESLKGAAISHETDIPQMLAVAGRKLRSELNMATSASALRTGVSII